MTKYRAARRGPPVRLNYVSFLSLEECAQRLTRLHRPRMLLFLPQTRVEVEALNANVYRFVLREGRPVNLVARGYVERIDAFSTHISGEIQVRWLPWAQIALMTVGVFGLLVARLPCIVLFALPGFFWFMRAFITGLRDEQERLLYILRDAVSY